VTKSDKDQPSDGINLKVIRGKARLQHVLSLLGYEKINTSVVERHHGTSRLHNQRKVRKTLVFSKSSRYHCWMSWLSVVQPLPSPWQFTSEGRDLSASSHARDGSGPDRSHPEHSGLLAHIRPWEAEIVAEHHRYRIQRKPYKSFKLKV